MIGLIAAQFAAKYGPETAKTIAKIIFWTVAALLLGATLLVAKCNYDQRAKVEVKLGKGQTGAAQASGHDAVNTLGNVMGNDAARDELTRKNADAIDKAEGADAPVSNAARAAGLHALCQRASYRRKHPECV
jgi:hypothetical protein